MRFKLAKHILIVEPEGGRLGALVPRLSDLGMVVLRATTVESAERQVRTTGLLSLVVIDDGIGAEAGAELLAHIKDAHEDLPVVWVSSAQGRTPLSRNEFMPDEILHPPLDADALSADVDRLLLDQLYPQDLVQLLATACCDVMWGAYRAKLTVADSHIRANRNALGTINAILPFCGRHIAGRIVVGAEAQDLIAIRALTLPRAAGELAAAEDLAGEYANLVAGRMKAHFAEFHLDFELGTPIIVTGHRVGLRYRASRPALVLVLHHDDAKLLVSFCFDTLDPSRIAPGTEDSTATSPSGELQFL